MQWRQGEAKNKVQIVFAEVKCQLCVKASLLQSGWPANSSYSTTSAQTGEWGGGGSLLVAIGFICQCRQPCSCICEIKSIESIVTWSQSSDFDLHVLISQNCEVLGKKSEVWGEIFRFWIFSKNSNKYQICEETNQNPEGKVCNLWKKVKNCQNSDLQVRILIKKPQVIYKKYLK